MSASTKKKLRSEQAAAALTEKQLAEKKEAKKVKIYTALAVVVLVLMIATVAVVSVVNSGIIEKSTTAVQIGDHKINSVEFSYSYIDAVNDFVQKNGSYLPLMGLDPSKPLDQQINNEETKETWADYFINSAKSSLEAAYAMSDAAKAEDHQLTDEEKGSIDLMMLNLHNQAVQGNYGSLNAFLKALYGKGASEKSYRAYVENQMLAGSYSAAHQDSLTYTDEDYREAEKENFNKYSSYTFNSYYLGTSAFLKGGTKDEEGNTTYTEEEKAASRKDAEAAFKTVLDAKSLEEFDAAIAAFEVNKDKENVKSSEAKDVLYGSGQMSPTIIDWLTSADRVEGDVTYLPVEATAEDGTKTVSGYYAVYFISSNDNTMPLVNVRHILVGFEGGTQNENGTVVYTDAEKAAAKEKAEAILNEWKSGEATEDSFAKLAGEKTSDPGSKEKGGLYEDVAPHTMVPAFDQWIFDSSRKAGDTGIVETEYGYHVMFFSGNAELTYRDAMIRSELTNKDMEAWFNSIVEKVEAEVLSTAHLRTGIILQPAAAK